MNAFYEHHKDSIRFAYRCFDRILLHAMIQPFQQEQRAVGLRKFRCTNASVLIGRRLTTKTATAWTIARATPSGWLDESETPLEKAMSCGATMRCTTWLDRVENHCASAGLGCGFGASIR